MTQALVYPPGWDRPAHGIWQAGQAGEAIQAVLAAIRKAGQGPTTPVPLILQLAYYYFHSGDPVSAAGNLERGLAEHPGEPDLLRNAGFCLSRAGRFDLAEERLRQYCAIRPDDFRAYDTLCRTSHLLGKAVQATEAGTQSLVLKDRAAGLPPAGWTLPTIDSHQWAVGKCDVIAFSLFGDQPRYLRGAIDNALAAAAIYPAWRVRFYVDQTVPADVCQALEELGCELVRRPPGQPDRNRLVWRFDVANDPAVGRFLVRDADAVISRHEGQAVDQWLASGRWFHAMRDWWTHTDLILAGMWGGIAGVLPPLAEMLAEYRPPDLEARNIDQWFLRDRVWAYVRTSCLVHDRCFAPEGASPWPGDPPDGRDHVGRDEFTAHGPAQELRLRDWIARLPGLAIN